MMLSEYAEAEKAKRETAISAPSGVVFMPEGEVNAEEHLERMKANGDFREAAAYDTYLNYLAPRIDGSYRMDFNDGMSDDDKDFALDTIVTGLTNGRQRSWRSYLSVEQGLPLTVFRGKNEVAAPGLDPEMRNKQLTRDAALKALRDEERARREEFHTRRAFANKAAFEEVGIDPVNGLDIPAMSLDDMVKNGRKMDQYFGTDVMQQAIDGRLGSRRSIETGEVVFKRPDDELKNRLMLSFLEDDGNKFTKRFKESGYDWSEAGIARWIMEQNGGRAVSIGGYSRSADDSLAPVHTVGKEWRGGIVHDIALGKDEDGEAYDTLPGMANDYLSAQLDEGGSPVLMVAGGGYAETVRGAYLSNVRKIADADGVYNMLDIHRRLQENPRAIEYVNAMVEHELPYMRSGVDLPRGGRRADGVLGEEVKDDLANADRFRTLSDMVKNVTGAATPEEREKELEAAKIAADLYMTRDRRRGVFTDNWVADWAVNTFREASASPAEVARKLGRMLGTDEGDKVRGIIRSVTGADDERLALEIDRINAKFAVGDSPVYYSHGTPIGDMASLGVDLWLMGKGTKAATWFSSKLALTALSAADRTIMMANAVRRTNDVAAIMAASNKRMEWARRFAAILGGDTRYANAYGKVVDLTAEERTFVQGLGERMTRFLGQSPFGVYMAGAGSDERFDGYLASLGGEVTEEAKKELRKYSLGASVPNALLMMGLLHQFGGDLERTKAAMASNEMKETLEYIGKYYTKRDLGRLERMMLHVFNTVGDGMAKGAATDFAFGFASSASASLADRAAEAYSKKNEDERFAPTYNDVVGSTFVDAAESGMKMALEMGVMRAAPKAALAATQKVKDPRTGDVRMAADVLPEAAIGARQTALRTALVGSGGLTNEQAREWVADRLSRIRALQDAGDEAGVDRLVREISGQYGSEVADRLEEMAYEFGRYKERGAMRHENIAAEAVEADLGVRPDMTASAVNAMFEKAGTGIKAEANDDGSLHVTVPGRLFGGTKDVSFDVRGGRITHRTKDGGFERGWATEVVDRAEALLGGDNENGSFEKFAEAYKAAMDDIDKTDADDQTKAGMKAKLRDDLRSGVDASGLLTIADGEAVDKGYFDKAANTVMVSGRHGDAMTFYHEFLHPVLNHIYGRLTDDARKSFDDVWGKDAKGRTRDAHEAFVDAALGAYKEAKAAQYMGGERADLLDFVREAVFPEDMKGGGAGAEDAGRQYNVTGLGSLARVDDKAADAVIDLVKKVRERLGGGETVLADGRKVFRRVEAELMNAVLKKGKNGIVTTDDGVKLRVRISPGDDRTVILYGGDEPVTPKWLRRRVMEAPDGEKVTAKLGDFFKGGDKFLGAKGDDGTSILDTDVVVGTSADIAKAGGMFGETERGGDRKVVGVAYNLRNGRGKSYGGDTVFIDKSLFDDGTWNYGARKRLVRDLSEAVVSLIAKRNGWDIATEGSTGTLVNSVSPRKRVGFERFDISMPSGGSGADARTQMEKWFTGALGSVVGKAIDNFVGDFNAQRRKNSFNKGADIADIAIEDAREAAYEKVRELMYSEGIRSAAKFFVGDFMSRVGGKTFGKDAKDSADAFDRYAGAASQLLTAKGWGQIVNPAVHSERIRTLFTGYMANQMQAAISEGARKNALAPLGDYIAEQFAEHVIDAHVRSVMLGTLKTPTHISSEVAQRAGVEKKAKQADIDGYRREIEAIYAKGKSDLVKAAAHEKDGMKALRAALMRAASTKRSGKSLGGALDKVLDRVAKDVQASAERHGLDMQAAEEVRLALQQDGKAWLTGSRKRKDIGEMSVSELRRNLASAYGRLARERAMLNARKITPEKLDERLGYDSFERLKEISTSGGYDQMDYTRNADWFTDDITAKFTKYYLEAHPEKTNDAGFLRSDPIFRAEFQKTAAAWIREGAKHLSFGQTRQALRTMADDIENGRHRFETVRDALKSSIEVLSESVRKNKVLDVLSDVEREIDRVGGSKPVVTNVELHKRKVMPRIQEYLRQVKSVLRMSQEEVDEEIERIEAKQAARERLDGIGTDGITVESADRIADRDVDELRLIALTRYGAAIEREIGDISDLAQVFAGDIAARRRQLEEVVAPKLDRADRVRKAMTGELLEHRTKTLGGNYDINNGKHRVRSWANSALYFFSPDLFAKLQLDFHKGSEGYEAMDRFRRDTSIGHARMERVKGAFNKAFVELVEGLASDPASPWKGKSFFEVMQELEKPRPELAKFSRSDWSIPKDGPRAFIKRNKVDKATGEVKTVVESVPKAVPPGMHDDPNATALEGGISLAQAMQIYLSMVQPDMKKNRIVWGYSGNVMRELRAALDANGFRCSELADYLVGQYEQLRQLMNPVSMRLCGTDILTTESYHPLSFENGKDPFERSTRFAIDPFPKFLRQRRHSPTAKLNERVDALRMFFDRLEQSAHYIGFGETIDRAKLVFQDKAVVDAFQKTIGKNATDQMFKQMTDALCGGRSEINDFFSTLTRFANSSTLFYRVPTSAKQLSGIGTWGAVGGMEWWLTNMGKLFRSTDEFESIQNEMGRLFGRDSVRANEGFSILAHEIGRAKTEYERKNAFKRFAKRYYDKGMTLTEAFDGFACRAFAGAYFNQKYRDALTKGLAKNRAKAVAERETLAEIRRNAAMDAYADTDYAIQLSQQSSRQEFRHAFQRGTSVERSMSQFAGPRFLQLGMEIDALHRFCMEFESRKSASPAERARYIEARNDLVSKFVALHVTTPFVLSAVNLMFGLAFHNPDDRRWMSRIKDDFVLALFTGAFGNAWLVGSLSKSAVAAINGSFNKDAAKGAVYEAVPALSKVSEITYDSFRALSDYVRLAMPGNMPYSVKKGIVAHTMEVLEDLFPVAKDVVNTASNLGAEKELRPLRRDK